MDKRLEVSLFYVLYNAAYDEVSNLLLADVEYISLYHHHTIPRLYIVPEAKIKITLLTVNIQLPREVYAGKYVCS